MPRRYRKCSLIEAKLIRESRGLGTTIADLAKLFDRQPKHVSAILHNRIRKFENAGGPIPPLKRSRLADADLQVVRQNLASDRHVLARPIGVDQLVRTTGNRIHTTTLRNRVLDNAIAYCDRVLSKIDMTSAPAGCWPWIGKSRIPRIRAVEPGRVYDGPKRSYAANRAAYELLIGPIPENHVLRAVDGCIGHPCVRPDHWRPVLRTKQRWNNHYDPAGSESPRS